MPLLIPKVCIIILHLKNIPCLAECLASLETVAYGNFDVIIVNNGSDDLRGIAGQSKLKVEVLTSPSNAGFACGNNLGIREAIKNQADYVLLLNDDTIVSSDFLDILVAEGEKDPLSGMLGPEVLYYGDRERIAFSGAKFDRAAGTFAFPRSGELSPAPGSSAPVESDYVTGCALLVKKSLIDKVGLLDERFFLYWEDSDWGLRAKKAGFRCLVVPAAKIWHKVSASAGGNDSPLKAYYKTLGHLLFLDLHAPRAKRKILTRFVRDIAWLLFKSSTRGRLRKAWAYINAIFNHYSGRGGRGWH